jgi:hypothetical protein
MSLTYSIKKKVVDGSARVAYVQFTTDNAYAAGGYPLAAADFLALTERGYSSTTGVSYLEAEKNANGYTVALDRANSKLKVFASGATEATTTTSTQVITACVRYGFAA